MNRVYRFKALIQALSIKYNQKVVDEQFKEVKLKCNCLIRQYI